MKTREESWMHSGPQTNKELQADLIGSKFEEFTPGKYLSWAGPPVLYARAEGSTGGLRG